MVNQLVKPLVQHNEPTKMGVIPVAGDILDPRSLVVSGHGGVPPARALLGGGRSLVAAQIW